jgi:hypothetical protein
MYCSWIYFQPFCAVVSGRPIDGEMHQRWMTNGPPWPSGQARARVMRNGHSWHVANCDAQRTHDYLPHSNCHTFHNSCNFGDPPDCDRVHCSIARCATSLPARLGNTPPEELLTTIFLHPAALALPDEGNHGTCRAGSRKQVLIAGCSRPPAVDFDCTRCVRYSRPPGRGLYPRRVAYC